MEVMNKWKQRGAWATLGAVVGYFAAAVMMSQPASAVATAGGVEGALLATGGSTNNAIEYVWHLDERGMLTCHLLGFQGRGVSSAPLDVKQAIKSKGGKKGKYAMVTGRYTTQGQISDVLYLTESSSSQIGVFTFNNDGIRLIQTLSSGGK
jgi:hypothetical protein